jgi:hypothetical protein
VVQAAGFDPDGLPAVELEAPAEAVVGEEVEIATPTAGLYAPTIDFGDGKSAAGTAAMHVYDAPGEYELTAAGAEELGYRTSARKTIKVVAGGGEEEPPLEEEKGDEGTSGGGGGPSSGGSSAAGGASSSGSPPLPVQGSGSPAEAGCSAAQAARAKAAKALRRVRLKLAKASGPRAHSRLNAVKRQRLAVLQRAEARLAAAC